MKKRTNSSLDVLLIGYEDQTSLGLRSIASFLKSQGYVSKLISYKKEDRAELLEFINKNQPLLIGFSIVFQFSLYEFLDLMSFLRDSGISQHFTAGGHLPSLRPIEVLQVAPHLDSIVRFEGELTILELLEKLDYPEKWFEIQGLAFRSDKQIICTQPRPLIEDLDSLPLIDHGQPGILGRDIRTASILASRGCLFECSFCSIRQFYGGAHGSLRRVRSSQSVVNEMKLLYEQSGVRFFLFQDDDFAARSKAQREWLKSFLDDLDQSGLVGNIAWKISCRVDDIDQQMLDACHARGLRAVYLGVESGNSMGLHIFNKHTTVEKNLNTIELLKCNNLVFNIGFMLFDPSSTYETLQENIRFLRRVASDGSFPVNFCKMLPYAGTPIENELRKAGRLKGSLAQPDYDFLDPRVDLYAYFVSKIFHRRNFDVLGLVNRLLLAQLGQDLDISLAHIQPRNEDTNKLREIIAYSNSVALDVLEKLLELIRSGTENEDKLMELANREWVCENECIIKLDDFLVKTNPELLLFFGKFIKRNLVNTT